MGHPTAFEHTAVVHRDAGELVAAVAPFVRGGVGEGEPVFVNLPGPHLRTVRASLGADAGPVVWTDTAEWEPHPARRLRAIGDTVAERLAQGAPSVRFVGACPLAGADPAMVPEWLAFDAALNEALAPVPVRMLCVYDGQRLPPSVIDEAIASHPTLGVDPPVANPDFEGAEGYLRRRRPDHLPVPGSAARVGGRVTPAAARRFVTRCLAQMAGADALADDLKMTLSELVTNAWQAGATSVTVSCWQADRSVAVQVDDDAPGLWDALAGYRRPDLQGDGGRGLWITRQLADVVRIRPTARGTSVRLRFLARPLPVREPASPDA